MFTRELRVVEGEKIIRNEHGVKHKIRYRAWFKNNKDKPYKVEVETIYEVKTGDGTALPGRKIVVRMYLTELVVEVVVQKQVSCNAVDVATTTVVHGVLRARLSDIYRILAGV